MTYKFVNCNLILGRGTLNELGIIFNFENKMKPPNCTATEFFVIKEVP